MLGKSDHLTSALRQVLEQRQTLSREHASLVLHQILDEGESASQVQIAALLGGLAARGETTEELAGFVECLRSRSTRIPLEPGESANLVDTCGTGGDLSGTFNLSTAAALVAAAAGAWVAKHGNRAVTSRCGSADVLEALGIPVDLTPQKAADSLRKHRFAFLPAPSLQPAMKAVLPIRKALGVRTVFNILGPMTNPAGASMQVLGVYSEHLVPVVAEALARLNTRHAFVVHGSGLDELSISGQTVIAEVFGRQVNESVLTPAHFGLEPARIETLTGGDAATNAGILRSIFAGAPGPCRDIVVMNASAVLVVAGLAPDFLAGAQLAAGTIDAGKVTALVSALASTWQKPQPKRSDGPLFLKL
jgi:anthranilate phosphoribosyltransferase